MPLKLTKRSKDDPEAHYHVTGTVFGVRVRQSTGTADRQLAEAERVRIESAIQAGKYRDPKDDFSVGDAFYHYIRHGGERTFVGPLNDAFGDVRVVDLTANDVADFVDENFPGRAGSYIARVVYSPLNAALNSAANANLCHYKKFKAPEFKIKRRSAAPDRWISTVLEIARPNLAAIMLFCTYTGCRAGEACAVKPEHIDFERERVLIEDTKTDKLRWVKLHPHILSAFRKLEPRHGEPLFGYGDTRAVNTAIRRLCRSHGLDYYSTHQWGRKAFATRHLVQGGKSLKWVADAGGWADIKMVAKHYAHLEKTHLDDGIVSVKIDTYLTHEAQEGE